MTDVAAVWADFHFLRPTWLAALPLLWLVVMWLARRRDPSRDWSGLIDAPLLDHLRLSAAAPQGRTPWPWLAAAWTIGVVALAGPAWERDSAPAFRAPAAWVVVLDLSPSMAATDVAPSRAARARYAIDDLLGAAHDARVGLVVFSDEPYTVVPLTDDAATVRGLLEPLAPDILPSQGDHLAPALAEAARLLERAGARQGHVVVLSDGFDDPAAALGAAGRLNASGASVDVVGIGTADGAPWHVGDGSFALGSDGKPQLARLDPELLQRLAAAGGGRYVDLPRLPELLAALAARPVPGSAAVQAEHLEVAHWRDAGAWLVPLVLLASVVLVRRGWL